MSPGNPDAWDAAVEILIEESGDEPDLDRIEGLGKSILTDARKRQSEQARGAQS